MAQILKDDVGVYIVGGKPTEEYLEKMEKWNLQNVHFLDFMKKEDLSKYYSVADIFVFPTREDIWGLVVNEAMAYGLPVISTDRCVAAIEMVRNGENGYVVPVNNVLELKKAVEKILNNRKLHQEMEKNALRTVLEKYTIEKMVQRHLEIFESENNKEKYS